MKRLISETVEIFFFNGFVEKVCNLFIYLLAVLDCCLWTFFSCIEQRLLFVVVCQLSLPWLLLSHSMGSRYAVSVVVGHWLSCSTRHRISLDQESNLCPYALTDRFLTTRPLGKSQKYAVYSH